MRIVVCMRYPYFTCFRDVVLIESLRDRVVELATNCYGYYVLQKALNYEEDIGLIIVSELLKGNPAQTFVNKHASHVWSKVGWRCLSLATSNELDCLVDLGVDKDNACFFSLCLVRFF